MIVGEPFAPGHTIGTQLDWDWWGQDRRWSVVCTCGFRRSGLLDGTYRAVHDRHVCEVVKG